ncbi:MAG TPA: PIN domain-containing protein, partial [Acidobacteriota bacterium]
MDTNVFVGAVMSAEGSNRRVLRRCLQGTDVPLLAQALFSEYRSVLVRVEVFESAPIPLAEREALFEAFCATA